VDHLHGGRRGSAGIGIMRGGAEGKDCAERRANAVQEEELKWCVIKRRNAWGGTPPSSSGIFRNARMLLPFSPCHQAESAPETPAPGGR
jgi:hypothetical protein